MHLFRTIKNRLNWYRMFFLHMRGARAIEKWQVSYARKIVRHAVRSIPVYAELYAAHGVRPDEIIRMGDFERLPIIMKDFFRGKAVEEYTDTSRLLRMVWKNTSGSSGEPFSVLAGTATFNPNFSNFTRYRFLYWDSHDMNVFKTFKTVRIDVKFPKFDNLLFINLSDFRRNPKKALREMADFQPDIITTFPSILLEMVSIIKSDKTAAALVSKYVVPFGEMLGPLARRTIAEAFSAEVYDYYGLIELCGSAAIECKYHDGMHVNSESVIVEVVDERGFPQKEKRRGRIIVTDLMNYNMPFIRYETGDQGVLTREKCACGLETPRIWVEGRYSAFLSFDGRKIHHLEFDGALDGFMDIVLQYQVVKHAEDRLAVRIIPGPYFKESDRDRIRESVRTITGQHIVIDVEIVAHITQTPRGKSKIVADESLDFQKK